MQSLKEKSCHAGQALLTFHSGQSSWWKGSRASSASVKGWAPAQSCWFQWVGHYTVHLYLLCVVPALPNCVGLAVLAPNTCTRLLQGPTQHTQGTCDGVNVSWELFPPYALAVCPKNLLGHCFKQEGSTPWLSVIIHCQNQYCWQACFTDIYNQRAHFPGMCCQSHCLGPVSTPVIIFLPA